MAARKEVKDLADLSVFDREVKESKGITLLCGVDEAGRGPLAGDVYAAACILPLTDDYSISRELGTRHRAAIGITETTDAVTLIVSEETGIISMTREGKLTRYLDTKSLNILLTELFTPDRALSSWSHQTGRKEQKDED